MLAELRIDPSDRVLDNESLDGSLGDNFSGFSIRVSRRENNMPVAKLFLGDRMGKPEADFLQAEFLRESIGTNL